MTAAGWPHAAGVSGGRYCDRTRYRRGNLCCCHGLQMKRKEGSSLRVAAQMQLGIVLTELGLRSPKDRVQAALPAGASSLFASSTS